MPIKICTCEDGTKGFKWGYHGHCYPTREQAAKQAQAAYANGYLGKSIIVFQGDASLFKAYIRGHYRTNKKTGARTFIAAHHDKRKPRHDKPLGMDFEQWRDSEVKRHLDKLKAEGKSTATVK